MSVVDDLNLLIVAAGVGQLLLAAASLLIPAVLNWKRELAGLNPLLRRLFWVYAGYIFATNVALGLVSLFAADALVAPAALALAVNGYAAAYWGSRLAIQFTLFRGLKPPGAIFQCAEAALVVLFVFLTAVYLAATVVVARGLFG